MEVLFLMKKFVMISAAILLSFSVFSVCLKNNERLNANAENLSEQEIYEIKKMVKDSKVCGVINKDCNFFNNINDYKAVGTLKRGTEVEIIQDKSCQYYFVREDENSEGKWISAEYISIPDDAPTNTLQMTKQECECYVDAENLESDTSYLVWVDIDRQLTHIFTKDNKKWELDRTFICSTGKNVSPTIRGIFKTSDKGEWFYSQRLGSGAKFYTRFNGSYFIHSVAMDENQNITDPILGQKRSSGCVRLSVDDAKFFYKKIPKGTTVYIN